MTLFDFIQSFTCFRCADKRNTDPPDTANDDITVPQVTHTKSLQYAVPRQENARKIPLEIRIRRRSDVPGLRNFEADMLINSRTLLEEEIVFASVADSANISTRVNSSSSEFSY